MIQKIRKKINFMQCGFFIIGILALIVFVVPLSLTVGLNIGNLTGIIVAVGFISYGIFYKRIKLLRMKLLQKRAGRVAVFFVDGMIILVICLVLILTILMVKQVANKPKGNETVIVLGCRVYGERPSLSLKERLEAAYEYLISHPEAYCVVSGGQGQGEDIAEAECMYRYLTEKGVVGERIFKEDASTSTRENIVFSLEVIEENHLPKDIAIVTSEYHQYRVSLIADDLGLKNTAVSGKTAKWLFPTFYVRELYAIIYEWVF